MTVFWRNTLRFLTVLLWFCIKTVTFITQQKLAASESSLSKNQEHHYQECLSQHRQPGDSRGLTWCYCAVTLRLLTILLLPLAKTCLSLLRAELSFSNVEVEFFLSLQSKKKHPETMEVFFIILKDPVYRLLPHSAHVQPCFEHFQAIMKKGK